VSLEQNWGTIRQLIGFGGMGLASRCAMRPAFFVWLGQVAILLSSLIIIEVGEWPNMPTQGSRKCSSLAVGRTASCTEIWTVRTSNSVAPRLRVISTPSKVLLSGTADPALIPKCQLDASLSTSKIRGLVNINSFPRPFPLPLSLTSPLRSSLHTGKR
jgi:hypothetical protein